MVMSWLKSSVFLTYNTLQCQRSMLARAFSISQSLQASKKKDWKPPSYMKKPEGHIPEKRAILKKSAETEYHELPVVVVQCTWNNTLLYLYDHLGTSAACTSAGVEGFRNSKRGSTYAGKVAGMGLARRAADLGVSRVRVKVRGIGPGRLDAIKGLSEGGMNIVSLTDTTPVNWNGPRPKKARRL